MTVGDHRNLAFKKRQLPQEFTRVLLNLISNGFYASACRKTDGGDPGFEPAER